MQQFQTVITWLKNRAENIVALLLASMFLTFLIQIVFRYLLNLPLGWSVEYVTIAWLWGILFGYAFVVRNDEVIRLDLLYVAVSRNKRRAMDIFTNTIVICVLAWSLPKTYGYVAFMEIERTAFMRIPFDLVFSIYIPFIISLIVRGALIIRKAILGIGYEENASIIESDPENV